MHSTLIRNDQKQRSPTERTGRRTCDGVIANCRRDRTRVATSYAQVQRVKMARTAQEQQTFASCAALYEYCT